MVTFCKLRLGAQALKENKVTEIEKMRALIYLNILLWTSVPLLNKLNWFPGSIFKPGFFIMVFGVLWCFQANSQGDNKDFITRMVCLGWLIGVRILLIGLVIGLIIFSIPEATLINLFGKKYQLALNLTIGSVCHIAFFVWMRSDILYISGASKSD